jgi:ABC-type uncharacterized transport system involved in gliding motility auxiliary subunit
MAGLLGAIGGVAFGFGLLSLLLAVFQPLMPVVLVWGNLAVGALLLVAGGTLGFDSLSDRLRSGTGRRAGVHGANAIVGTMLGLALLGLLAFLSTRYSQRFDWTEQRVNTLSDQSLGVLQELEAGDDETVLTAFFREQDSTLVRDLLERYDHATDRVRVRFVDPNQRPDLVEAYQITADDLARGLLLVSRGDDSVTVSQFSEADITNALVKLTRTASRMVYFLEGHNERRIGSQQEAAGDAATPGDVESASGLAGLSRAAAALRNETHVVSPLLLATHDQVPADADLVIIAGPTQPLFEGERQALERYLAQGGALLVMVDPRSQTNLYEDLRRWGIEVGDDVIVDPVMSVNRQPTAPVAEHYGEAYLEENDEEGGEARDGNDRHPIGAGLSRTVFSMVRSVTPGDDGITPLVQTSPSSWAERGIEDWMKTGQAMQDDDDLIGPVSIAVVGQPVVTALEPDAAPRIAVFGDSNFATNELIEIFSNRDLFLNTVSWLIGDVEQISVRPNVSRSSTISLTAGQLQAIQFLSLFVLPEGIALAGVFTWWLRRRSPASRV